MPNSSELSSDRSQDESVVLDRPHFRLDKDYSTGVLQLVTRCFEQAEHARLEAELGAQLPYEPNAILREDSVSIAWIAPGQWYATGPENEIRALHGKWLNAVADNTFLCLNMSDQLSVLHLEGAAAPKLLSSLVPIDIDSWVRGKNECLRTVMGNFSVFLERLEAAQSFRLIVDQSLSNTTCELLADAARGRLLA